MLGDVNANKRIIIILIIGLFSDGSEARPFAWSAVVIAGHSLLQRPFRTSSAIDNNEFLRQRLTFWKSGKSTALLGEPRCIQAHFPSVTHKRTQSRAEVDGVEFAKMVCGERIGTATHYLEDNDGGCVLPLDQEINGRSVLDVLREKNQDPVDRDESILLDDELLVRTDGVRYFGGAVGTQELCDNLVHERVVNWAGLIQRLSTVAMTQPPGCLSPVRFIPSVKVDLPPASYCGRPSIAWAPGGCYCPESSPRFDGSHVAC